jgi:hypothetical protein
MSAPYAMWDHVPVYIRDPGTSNLQGSTLATWDMFLRDYLLPPTKPAQTQSPPRQPNTVPTFSPIEINIDDEKYNRAIAWHKQQLRDGVRDGIAANREAMAVVPPNGFYVTVRRHAFGRGTFSDYVELREDVSTLTFSTARPRFEPVISIWSDSLSIDTVGSDYNSLPELFDRLSSRIPKAWQEWLAKRRLKRWKPIPTWLLDIRAQRKRRS